MKSIITIVLLLAVYGGSLVIKNKQIEKEKSRYIPTTYDLQKKDGIPVTVDDVKSGKFQSFITISGTIVRGQLKSAVAPVIKRQIRVGASARLELEAGLKEVLGRVSSVSTSPSLLTGLYEVTVNFEKTVPKDLGSITVDIPVKEINNVLIVPRQAVSARESKPFVFVLEKDKLVKKVVEIAGANPSVYWIKSGLKQDEIVITSDTRYFAGGEFVKVMNETRNNI